MARLEAAVAAKDKLEMEIVALVDDLDSRGVGLKGPLVDAEGFPRADVDLIDVRTKRGRVAVLQNDHKSAMHGIEKLLQEVHAEARAKKEAGTGASSASGSSGRTSGTGTGSSASAAAELSEGKGNAMPVIGSVFADAATDGGPATDADSASASAEALPAKPLAKVNSVAPSSPADEAGLKAGDAIMRFGTATSDNSVGLEAIVPLVSNSIGRPINVVVRRGDAILPLVLTPHSWSGGGVLGVHLLPWSS